MEENVIRALTIGAIVFILVITVSVIIMYFNTATDAATKALETRVDYGKIYKTNINEIGGKKITGIELKDIIRNNFADYTKITIKADTLVIHTSGTIYRNENKEITVEAKDMEYGISRIINAANYEITAVILE